MLEKRTRRPLALCISKRALARASETMLLFYCVLALGARAVRAEPLRIDASAERMRVDGMLKEWRGARFTELGSGDDASLRYALASADGGLYLGAEVRDDRLVAGDDGDALVLTLALPEAGGWLASEVWLYPGEAGHSKAHARLAIGRGPKRAEPRVQVVEGPRTAGSGYLIEAFIPWAALPGASALWEQGKGSLRFVDVDRGQRPETTLATAQAASAGDLPRLALGVGHADLLGSFLEAKQLGGVEPRYDLRADVSGDAQPERVVVVDRYVLVYGPGYRQGETYGYFELPIGLGGGLKSAALIDLTGDGRPELATTLTQRNELGARELWLVLALAEAAIAPRFTLELKKEIAGGFVESSLHIVPPAKGAVRRVPTIEVKVGRAQGVDAGNYREASAADAQPILLPWGDIEARSYAFDGTSFALVAEKRAPRSAAADDKRAVTPLAAAKAPQAEVSAEAHPGPTSAGASARAAEVLALFKSQHQLPANERPSRSLRANVLLGPAEEQVDLFGNQLVFTGTEVGQGNGYLTYALPMKDARDLVALSAVDVTGEGGAELLVRVRQTLSGAQGAERELLLVLRGDRSGQLARMLSVEVARRQGARAIENRVQSERGLLLVEPGGAKGWSQQTYPFAPDAVGGVEPLLLPWSDRAVRYRYQSGALLRSH